MINMFLKKLLDRDFDALTLEELKIIIHNNDVFALKKKDLAILEKLIEKPLTDDNSDKIKEVLRESLPSSFAILSNLDKCEIHEGTIDINFREAFVSNLKQMNNFQLCVFIDKLLKVGKEERIRFFKSKDYSLHMINSVVSSSFELPMVFEFFKPDHPKSFRAIEYDQIDKDKMINTLNNQIVRYLYVVEAISRIVLETAETELLKTKINKRIQTEIIDYVDIIKKEKKAVRATGIAPRQTWTYTLCNILDITAEEDDEFYDEEDDDE
jgi:hypothetical protein